MANPVALHRTLVYRLAETLPIGPVGMGVGLALIAAASGALPVLWVEPGAGPDGWALTVALRAVLSGYALTASLMVANGARRDLADLRPVAICSLEAFDERVSSSDRFPMRGLLVCGAFGLLVPITMTLTLSESLNRQMFLAGGWAAGLMVLISALIFWHLFIALLYISVVLLGRFAAFGARDARVDLLDLDTLRPFGRVGLRVALAVLGVTPILFGTQLLAGSEAGRILVSAAGFLPAFLLAIFALLAPSWSIHRRIQQEKEAELSRLRGALAGNRAAMAGSPLEAEAEELSRVELVLYRQQIAELREWPLDASALRRFGLYLLIPLGSWVGSALMERVVDRIVE
jgi:hypothetical protein